MSEHVAVLGAGNIAQALAGHLALSGQAVRVYNRWDQEIAPLREKGSITLTGALEGQGWLSVVSSSAEEVVRGASLVVIATPAYAHQHMAEACAELLTDDQIVLFHPTGLGSSLELARHLRSRALLVESAASLYIARLAEPGAVRVLTLKTGLQVAAYPASRTAEALERLAPLFPGRLLPARNVLETGLNNNQAAIHCPTVLFNLTRVERGEDWLFWQGITESVANLVAAVDAERVDLGRALGLELESVDQALARAYGLEGLTLLEALHNVFSRGGGAKGPADRGHRYIFEDVPYALVPWASLGRQLGLAMPVTQRLVETFCSAYRQDLWSLGRTADSLGLAGLDATRLRNLVDHGSADPA